MWVQKPPAEEWGQSTLEVVDLLGHRVTKLVTVPASLQPDGVYWAADGMLVVQLAGNNAGSGSPACGCEIRQIPAGGGSLTALTHKTPTMDALVQVSPDGTTIVVQAPGRGHQYQYRALDGSVLTGPALAPGGWADWAAAAPTPSSGFDRVWLTGPPGGRTVPPTPPTPPRPHFGTDGIIELAYAPPGIAPIVSKYLAEAPDGADRTLVYTTPLPVLDGEVLDSTDFYGGAVLGPGGRAIADLDPASSALEVGPAGGALGPVWPRHGDGTGQGWGGAPVWDPDGLDIAVATNGWGNGYAYADGLDIVCADGSKSKRVLAGGLVDGPAWSPDGDELALWVAKRPGSDNEPTTLEVVNLLTGTATKLATVQSYFVPEGMSWSPDGDLDINIYNSHEPSTGGIAVDQISAAGGPLTTWPVWPSLAENRLSTSLGLLFSPNGAQVLVDRGGSFVVLTSTARLYSVATPNASVLEWASSSPAPQSTFDRHWH